MLLTVPIYFAIIFSLPRISGAAPRRWDAVKYFLIGMAAPLLAAVLLGGFYFDDKFTLGSAAVSLSTAVTFLGLNRPYHMVNFPFDHTLSLTFILWGLGLWLSLLSWVVAYPDKTDFQSQRYLATSAVWITLYFFLMATLEYFPARYRIHILLPMALFVAVGMSLLQRLGIQKLIEFSAAVKGPAGLLWLGAVSLPFAAILTPMVLMALGHGGIDPARLMAKLGTLTCALFGSVCFLYRFKYNAETVRFFLFFPLIGGIGWGLASTLSGSSFRLFEGFPSLIALLPPVIVIASTLLFVLGVRSGWWRSPRCAQLIPLCTVFYLAISLAGHAPGYFDPHYTMRNASRDLGALFSGSQAIASIGADGLFNENDLPYESLTAPEFNDLEKKPEVVAVAFYYKWVKTTLDRHYHATKTYDLYNHPRPEAWVRSVALEPEAIPVTIYRKNEAKPK
jgi:hypothetical protein